MSTDKLTPGGALNALMLKHNLNANRLAKAIGLSTTIISLISHDQNPISTGAAMRLSKFFKTKPEYWLEKQMSFDIAKAEKNKKLTNTLNNIVEVSKYTFIRKPYTSKNGKSK